MPLIERSITVSFRHQVHFTDHAFSPSNLVLRDILTDGDPKRMRKALVVIDEALAKGQPDLAPQIQAYFAAFPGVLKLVRDPFVVEGGEQTKNDYHHVSDIQTQIDRHHLDRHSYVIVIGGGALLDMAGLASSTAHRGMRHIRMPTTTLSQNDSGVGVKNGINAFGKKNFIGTFSPPFAVINDFQLLASLSPRDKRAGYIEAVKVALIRDAAFFEEIKRDADALRQFEAPAMRRLIYRCAELHMNHIATSGDPFEFGSARPLDFGHWVAHKLEQLSEYRIRHGEAVAIGIAVDVLYAKRMRYLPAKSAERILALIESLGFDLFANEVTHTDSDGNLLVLRGLEEFREHLGGELSITLLKEIGKGFEVHEMKIPEVILALKELSARSESSAQGGSISGIGSKVA